jgi:hypothetical protein
MARREVELVKGSTKGVRIERTSQKVQFGRTSSKDQPKVKEFATKAGAKKTAGKHRGSSEVKPANVKPVAPDAKSRKAGLSTVEQPDFPPPAFQEFNNSTAPPWLAKAIATAIGLSPIRGSEFAVVEKLPPIVVGKYRLNSEQVAAVLLALQHAEFDNPHDLLDRLKNFATAESLDAFAWALMSEWLDAGANPRHKWAMRAIGFLGSDALAIKLTPLIRAWPVENYHQRAVLGLECLMKIGTDKAITQLNLFAMKPVTVGKATFSSLQDKACSLMEAVASQKGLTARQLEDRLVPDCGLDDLGSRVFDFGPRQFHLVLSHFRK